MKGSSLDGSDLRLKQRGHEEWVLCQFDGFNPSVLGVRSDREPVRNELLNVGWRKTKIAPMKSRERIAAANLVQSSSWNGRHRALLRHEAAAQSINHQSRFARRRFCVIGRHQSGHIAGELDDRILKPTTRSHEWLT